MSSALLRISTAALHHIFDFPADCEIEVAPENEEGNICLIVTHDSIPDEETEVTAVVRRQVYQHEQISFGHFLPRAEAEALEASVA
jgi:hypothetical protein